MNHSKRLFLLYFIFSAIISYAQKQSFEQLNTKLYGKWMFVVDSSNKYFREEVLVITHRGNSEEIKMYDPSKNDGYRLFKVSDSTNTCCYLQSRKSATGYYLTETDCTLPICHDPSANLICGCFYIESVEDNKLILYTLINNTSYILTKEHN